MSGGDEGHVSNSDGSRAMVRSHYPLARSHAVPGVRGSNGDHCVARLKSLSLGRKHHKARRRESIIL